MSATEDRFEPARSAQTRHRSQLWVWVLLGFSLIAGALLFTEHRAHLLGALIYLPLLACPLMHLFMHGSHGGHRHRSHTANEDRRS